MADLRLDFLVLPTYDSKTLGIADASTYSTTPVSAPTIEISVPGFAKISLPFATNDFSVYTSTLLGITDIGDELVPLPDGVYIIRYSVSPAYLNYVEKSIMRVEQIQEQFDKAFMHLDMMECDKAIKAQAKIDLNTIYFFIQGSIAAANNCAINEANKLYVKAGKMLDYFVNNNCGCSGNTMTIIN